MSENLRSLIRSVIEDVRDSEGSSCFKNHTEQIDITSIVVNEFIDDVVTTAAKGGEVTFLRNFRGDLYIFTFRLDKENKEVDLYSDIVKC